MTSNEFKTKHGDNDVEPLVDELLLRLLHAPQVDTGHWQAKEDTPMSVTRELLNSRIEIPIAPTVGSWQSFMRPNLPWAEDHFSERVSGTPFNPPPSHVNWPYNQQENKEHMDGNVFSHTYPERLWPKYAGEGQLPRRGIRYSYGDLDDAVKLLMQHPYTRQCYVPLWFPEDLFAASQEAQRVPCTLGYHFVLRDGHLHCFYPMRSLDVMRYFRDDAYMAGRLCQWMIGAARYRSGRKSALRDKKPTLWHEVEPGMLTMHVVSLHIFQGDVANIEAMYKAKARKEES